MNAIQNLLNKMVPKRIDELEEKTVYYSKKEVKKALKEAHKQGRETVWQAVLKFLNNLKP